VLEEVSSVKDDKELEYQHRMHQLQQLLNESTERLCEPEILKSLRDQQEDKSFWATVDLKALVQWKMKKCKR
jgi:hypothetical protein